MTCNSNENINPQHSSTQHAQPVQLPPGKLLAQSNNLFVTVPPAWLEIALNCAVKSANTIAHSPTILILNQYFEQSSGRAINFDPFYCIATVLRLLYYMHNYFLLKIFALFDSNYVKQDDYDS